MQRITATCSDQSSHTVYLLLTCFTLRLPSTSAKHLPIGQGIYVWYISWSLDGLRPAASHVWNGRHVIATCLETMWLLFTLLEKCWFWNCHVTCKFCTCMQLVLTGETAPVIHPCYDSHHYFSLCAKAWTQAIYVLEDTQGLAILVIHPCWDLLLLQTCRSLLGRVKTFKHIKKHKTLMSCGQ